jgi:hypothetical protein
VDQLDLSNPPVLHQFARSVKYWNRTLLQLRLEDYSITPGDIDHDARLSDRQRKRLLAVDILAGPRR